jgi:molybdenum cofactor sulfurtransferase
MGIAQASLTFLDSAESEGSDERAAEGDSSAMRKAEAAFRQAQPAYANTDSLDRLRARDYARLDAQRHVYLDYTGASLHAESQLRAHMDLLNHQVFGNPHSVNPASGASTALVEAARAAVLRYFNASPEDFTAIFTANASGALKLVGEAYPFAPGCRYLLTMDNHNSVNGIREFARAKGAAVTYVPVTPPELQIDEARLMAELDTPNPSGRNLFAYPAQSNFSGVQHDLEWIGYAQGQGWDVLLDASAFVPTNPLDLARWRPDFVTVSFYKMFGYPTGLGCLIARRSTLAGLKRPWFAGGAITIASVQGDGHYLAEGAAGFEDGTVNFLNIPAVERGLRYLEEVGIEIIRTRVACLTQWLLSELTALRHDNGCALVRIYGPKGVEKRGSTVTFNFYDRHGRMIDYRLVEDLAGRANISLRTGCFCNPGADEAANGLTSEQLAPCFGQAQPLTFEEFLQRLKGEMPGAVRVSLGITSNFPDVFRFLRFARRFLND